jgi:ornithine decarboxylase
MNCVLYDHATLAVRVLDGAGGGGKGGERERAVAAALEAAAAGDASSPPPPCHRGCCAHIPPGELRSTLFGPTCDGLDTVLRDHPLPRLAPGAWLAFPRMGAYTVAGASAFNGFDATAPAVTYVWSETG